MNMERLTSNKNVSDMSMFELIYNSCYKDDKGSTRYRDRNLDIDSKQLVRNLAKDICNEDLTDLSDEEFDEYMIQMVVVGQSIGNLDVVFKELSTYYARQKELNYQIQDAITYPFVLILMMFVIVATLIFKVFPIFENILSQMSMSLSLMYSARILSYIGFFILLFILFRHNSNYNNL